MSGASAEKPTPCQILGWACAQCGGLLGPDINGERTCYGCGPAELHKSAEDMKQLIEDQLSKLHRDMLARLLIPSRVAALREQFGMSKEAKQ